jgi:hypothetical protein
MNDLKNWIQEKTCIENFDYRQKDEESKTDKSHLHSFCRWRIEFTPPLKSWKKNTVFTLSNSTVDSWDHFKVTTRVLVTIYNPRFICLSKFLLVKISPIENYNEGLQILCYERAFNSNQKFSLQ